MLAFIGYSKERAMGAYRDAIISQPGQITTENFHFSRRFVHATAIDGNQKFSYQNKVHNFAFLFYWRRSFYYIILTVQVLDAWVTAICLSASICLPKPPIYLVFQSKLLKQIKKFEISAKRALQKRHEEHFYSRCNLLLPHSSWMFYNANQHHLAA